MIKCFFVLSICLSQFFHNFHVSHTTLYYNESTSSIEITSRIAIEDLEETVESINSTKLRIGDTKENKSTDHFIKNYFSNHFKVFIDDKTLNYEWVGKEIGKDLHDVYLYFEILNSKPINEIESIEIENSLLLEKSKKQSNIVHIEFANKKLNINFTKDLRQKKINL